MTDAARLGRRDDRFRARMRDRVGVHVGDEEAVVALGAERAVEQRVDRERLGLIRLVGHLRRRLVDVDHGAVEPSRTASACRSRS